ncbi:fused MFS/spermidine synthase [Sideroxydans lithotrophicus]|nr:fused MFS/spermidine synthase [Sideroxydans lithotrophicus]
MLSMQFGVSIFGVVLTVTAYMIGLGSGSLAGARWAPRWGKPLYIFAILEMAIALYALLLPGLMHVTSGWMEGWAAQLSLVQWYLLQGIEALCLLVIPAFAMGVGFALILKFVEETPISLAKIYGFNTIGGVFGALFPLWSLPALGWTDSIRIVAALGLIAGSAALVISKRARLTAGATSKSEIRLQRPPLQALLIYAGIGAGSIMLEIGWIRLYGMVMLRTEYVLGVILAVFLLGIALGSLLLPSLKKHSMTELIPLVIGIGVLIGLWLLPATSAWVERSDYQSFFGALTSQALILGVFTLPITLALGAWLPILANRYGSAEPSGVWFYGANCLGGAFGAVVGCLVLIPVVGSFGMVALAGLAIACLGLIWVKPRWPWLIFPCMLIAAWYLRSMPPVHELMPKIEAGSQDIYHYEDAIAQTHVVQQQDGQRVLLSDLQRMDASSDPAAVEIQMDQARLALLLHRNPRSILFLGLGTGISAAGSKPFPGLVRSAVELSRGSIYAAKHWFAPVNDNIMDQLQVQRDDARHYLNTTQRQYDVIVGDLFHPDLAGMGSLLSVQQFKRARDHLNPDGIFVQWLALNQFDIQSLNVVMRSFQRVFPNAQIFMDGMHLALVGPNGQFAGASALLENLSRMPAELQSQSTGGEGAWTWLGRYWGPIVETKGPLQDEWVPYVEFKLPRARYDGSVNLASLMLWLLQRHPAPEEAMKILGISESDKGKFGRAYVSTELTVRAWATSVQGDVEKATNLIWLAYQANPQDHWIASALADSMMQSRMQATQQGLSEGDALQRVLKIFPNHVNALRSLWHLEESAGNVKLAESYRLRLHGISPLDAETSTAP